MHLLYIHKWYRKNDPSVWPVWIFFLHDRFRLSWLSLNSSGIITSHQRTLCGNSSNHEEAPKIDGELHAATRNGSAQLMCLGLYATEHTEWRPKCGCSHANAQQEAKLMIHPMIFAVHKHLSDRSCNADHRKNQDPELQMEWWVDLRDPFDNPRRVLILNELPVSSICFLPFQNAPSEQPSVLEVVDSVSCQWTKKASPDGVDRISCGNTTGHSANHCLKKNWKHKRPN